MSDEIRSEEEVEAHGVINEGPLVGDPAAEQPAVEATEDEPDVEAHGVLQESPISSTPTHE